MSENARPRPIHWANTILLVFLHTAAIGGTWLYVTRHGVTTGAVILAVLYGIASGLSITGGYHRLFSHRAYTAHPLVRGFYLLVGAGTFQNSALKWSKDHRVHHTYVDQEEDPYNIKKGFWWAHMGWVFYQDPPNQPLTNTRDLEGDPLVRFQHRHYVATAIAGGFGIPLLLGWAIGDPWGGLVLAGFLRIVVLYQSTFCVNSVAHALGRQPFSERDSSRDHVLTALITLGEGYHNFHHTFPADYRNGVRGFQLDPTKWFIYALSSVGLTSKLVRLPDDVILRARLRVQAARARREMTETGWLDSKHQQLEAMLDRWSALRKQVAQLRQQLDHDAQEMRASVSADLREARVRFFEAYREWCRTLRSPAFLPTEG